MNRFYMLTGGYYTVVCDKILYDDDVNDDEKNGSNKRRKVRLGHGRSDTQLEKSNQYF